MTSLEIVSRIVLPAVAVLLGTIGGGMTVFTYWRNSKTRRAEWLCSLYEKFYEHEQYKNVRRILDYKPEKELRELYRSISEDGGVELSEQVVDYLNFFELIASLWVMKQLSMREVRMLFDYYVKLNVEHEHVVRFIEAQGFENLRKMITALDLS